jgi:Tol biopolymer transport system component
LEAGAQLGPYRVIAPLGAGGMGEVYRARDTKLDRDVALKILGPAFAEDPDRLDRFQREAKTLASLNHPHIAQIYGLEGNSQCLVMELVEGEDLSQRIARGPLPADEVLAIARQVADALEAAHEQGIIHRDLKPANIKIRPDGTVKVLDFGLAKLAVQERTSGSAAARVSISPTVASPAMTAAGIILGTAAYMSPEQARGKPVDKRTDVWSFGCVLYEMVTGHRPFDGDDVVSTIGAVIHKEPEWSHIPASVPPSLRVTIERCLQKDPKQRIRDIGDARLAMEGALGAGSTTTTGVARGGASNRTLATVAAVAALAAGSAVWWFNRPAPIRRAPITFQVLPRDAQRFANFFNLSPDGTRLAYLAGDLQGRLALWIRSLETGEVREITRAGSFNSSIIWSPDGRSLAFNGLNGFMRFDIEGDPPQHLATVTSWAGGDWTTGDVILFGRLNGPLMQISAKGGTAVEVTSLDASRGETGHLNPMFLPDGRHFIYLRSSTNPANSGIFIGSLDAKPEEQPLERLISATENALYVRLPESSSAGRLLYLRDGALMAQAFDDRALKLVGDPVRVADDIGVAPATYAHVSVSKTGTLAYATRAASTGGTPTWIDRTGRELGIAGGAETEGVIYPRISPDGKRVALVTSGDVWAYDLTGRPPVRLTHLDTPGTNYSPIWTPDGQTIVYEPAGSRELRAIAADGSVTAARSLSPPGHLHPLDWSADGTELLVAKLTGGEGSTSWDILRIPFGKSGDPIPVVATPAAEGGGGAALSPNKRFLAYTSDTTGTREIWVRPYPGPGPAERISPNGGTEPVWSRDGRELVYLENNRFMSVKTSTEGRFTFSAPTFLFETQIARSVQPPSYDLAPDGRFLVTKAPRRPPTPINVIVNWGGGQ